MTTTTRSTGSVAKLAGRAEHHLLRLRFTPPAGPLKRLSQKKDQAISAGMLLSGRDWAIPNGVIPGNRSVGKLPGERYRPFNFNFARSLSAPDVELVCRVLQVRPHEQFLVLCNKITSPTRATNDQPRPVSTLLFPNGLVRCAGRQESSPCGALALGCFSLYASYFPVE